MKHQLYIKPADRFPKANLFKLAMVLCTGLLLLSAACGGGSNSSSAQPQQPNTLPPPVPINAYFGSNGDIWSINLDHVNNQVVGRNFTKDGLSNQVFNGPATGNFATVAGYLQFNLTNIPFPPVVTGNTKINGFALDIPSRFALVRFGDQTNSLVPAVASNSCSSLSTSTTFQYVTFPNSTWRSLTDTAYGTFTAMSNGSSWNISNITQFLLTGGAPANPGTGLPQGFCGNSTLGFVVTTTPSNVPPIATVTLGFAPSGFFLEDNGSAQASPPGVMPSNALGAGSGAVGIVQPTSQLGTAGVVGAHYLGFLYQPVVVLSSNSQVTQLVSFGCSGTSCPQAPSPTAIVGGTYPNDDPTQPPNQNLTIDLGVQDSANNGLYRSASLSLSGTAFPAVAVVGSPENRFAIFILAENTLTSTPISLVLVQQ